MGCECYKIGGPWITFDPECPAHGYQAQREEEERNTQRQELDERIEALETRVANLLRDNSVLRERITKLENLNVRPVRSAVDVAKFGPIK